MAGTIVAGRNRVRVIIGTLDQEIERSIAAKASERGRMAALRSYYGSEIGVAMTGVGVITVTMTVDRTAAIATDQASRSIVSTD